MSSIWAPVSPRISSWAAVNEALRLQVFSKVAQRLQRGITFHSFLACVAPSGPRRPPMTQNDQSDPQNDTNDIQNDKHDTHKATEDTQSRKRQHTQKKKMAVAPPCEMVVFGVSFPAVDGWMPTCPPLPILQHTIPYYSILYYTITY